MTSPGNNDPAGLSQHKRQDEPVIGPGNQGVDPLSPDIIVVGENQWLISYS